MKRVLVYSQSDRICLALMEEDRLVEWTREMQQGKDDCPVLGSILMGRIQQVQVSLNAAYVDIGLKEPAFLPLDSRDLQAYQAGAELPVQIKKYAEGYKKAVVTDNYSLQGRFTVLTALQERIRLKELASRFPGKGQAGYILRTESAGAPEQEILQEAKALYEAYRDLEDRKKYTSVGEILYRNDSFILNYLMSAGIGSLDEILFDSAEICGELREKLVLQHLSYPQERLRVVQDSRFTLADLYRVDAQLTDAMKERLFLQDQGYLVIQKTEALTSIDVNSGNFTGFSDKEKAVTDFNLRVIPEIVRQIRLRNLSGIILIDFINMNSEDNRQQVLEAVRKEFQKDRRKVTVYGFTSLQLCEISREKAGLPLAEII